MESKVNRFRAFRLLSLLIGLTISTFAGNAMTLQQYYAFDNLGGITQSLCVRSIAQSADGMIWLATESGLYSYDGQRLMKREMEVSVTGKQDIGCLNNLLVDGDSLIIGCDNGLLSFNLKTYRLRWLSFARNERVKDIVRTRSSVWVATERAIYQDGKPLSPCPENVISLYGVENHLFIGTSGAIYGYAVKERQLERISSGIAIATCMYTNKTEDLLWVGSANSVSNWSKRTLKKAFSTPVPVAKSLCQDKNGNILIGTDNGLYIVGNGHEVSAFHHDAKRENSLAGDVVWCIFKDRSNNIWIGTNCGVSLLPGEGIMTTYFLPSLTGESSGNQFFSTILDSRGRFWLGGSNGLMCIEHLGKPDQSYRWYRMNDVRYPLPHNRIRVILEDRKGNILVGGDMGLMLYDEVSKQFQRFSIDEDPFNWVYRIRVGKEDELIITTFSATYFGTLNRSSHLVIVNKTTQRENISDMPNDRKWLLEHYGLAESYLSAFLERTKGLLLLGGSDKFSIVNTNRLNEVRKNRKLSITDIKINDIHYVEHKQILNGIVTLRPNEKMVEVMFSDFNYTGELTHRFLYRIDEGDWIPVHAKSKAIVLTNLDPGNFHLSIRFSDTLKESINLEFNVLSPWYATKIARFIYLSLFILMLYGIYHFFRQRKRNRLEREEHQAFLIQAKKKEKELLSDKEYLATQLRMQLLAKVGQDGVLSEDEKCLLKITKIIEDNLSDFEFNVNTLCALSDMGSKQLYRKIKVMTGMTTVAYIRDQRMKKAATLLSKGNFTVSEVMYMVGFSNPSYFSRCFTEEYGIPPSEYNV